MTKSLPPITDWAKYRNRIEYEDNLLNERINIFLVINGLGATAFSLADSYGVKLILTATIILVDMFLSICIMQTAIHIKNLTIEYMEDANDPIDMRVRYSLNWVPIFLKPTPILGLWLPIIITSSWLLCIIILLCNK